MRILFAGHNEKEKIWKTTLLEENYHGVPGRIARKTEDGVIVICKNRGILINK